MSLLSKRLTFAITLPLFALACGEEASISPDAPKAACSPGSALIWVADGTFSTGCGCAEQNANAAPGTGPLTCTVPAGTVIFFNFSSARQPHQIVPSASSSAILPATPIYDPSREPRAMSYAVQPRQAGTYDFHDAQNASLTGRLIVL